MKYHWYLIRLNNGEFVKARGYDLGYGLCYIYKIFLNIEVLNYYSITDIDTGLSVIKSYKNRADLESKCQKRWHCSLDDILFNTDLLNAVNNARNTDIYKLRKQECKTARKKLL